MSGAFIGSHNRILVAMPALAQSTDVTNGPAQAPVPNSLATADANMIETGDILVKARKVA